MEFTMKLRKPNRSKNTNRALSSSAKPKPSKKRSVKSKKCICILSSVIHADFPNVWSELRQNMQLCDGVVKCEDSIEFKVHRAILSAVSPFFKALFLNTLNRGQPEETEAIIQVPSDIFSLILDYAYSGECAVTVDNVQSLLAYADQLEVIGCIQYCCQYIIDNLDPSNCLEVLLFARQYFCHDLEEKGRKYIRHHFKEVMQYNPDFVNLTRDELFDILSDDELNAKSEGLVFEAIKLWVEFSKESRRKNLPKLLTCVRLGLLVCHFYTSQVLKWNLILEDIECQKILHNATLFLSSRPCENFEYGEIQNISRPRVPFEVLFAIGGWSAGSPTSFIETYDSRADRWLLCVNTDSIPRAYHGICTLDGLIYMIGGFDGQEHFNSMRSFNPVSKEWKEHACMYNPRCYVSIAVYESKIYAIGGYNGRARMSSAERYDPETNQWELIAPMQKQRSDASAAVVHDKIYVVGGFNGNEVLRSAEIYEPNLNQWTLIASMNAARSGVSVVSYNDEIYALGGFNGYTRLKSVEKYSVERGGWTYVENMMNPRSNFSSVVLDEMIFVIGGFNGSKTIEYVEKYNTEQNMWFTINSMNLNRSALGACVLPGLSNAKDYSYVYKSLTLGLPEAS